MFFKRKRKKKKFFAVKKRKYEFELPYQKNGLFKNVKLLEKIT